MNRNPRFAALRPFAAALAILGAAPFAAAHCDTLDGPVVAAARQALAKGDASAALAWVRAQDEPEIRSAFARTLKVRTASADAKALADTYFFETLVRVHRAGEGMPYTGLKPAGTVTEPAIVEADRAVKTGVAKELANDVALGVKQSILASFAELVRRKKDAGKSVAAGRAYVESYVRFIHLVEAIHGAGRADGHGAEGHGDV